MKALNTLANDLVTIAAIAGLVYLGHIGVVDTALVGAIAGLGGYRMHKARKAE